MTAYPIVLFLEAVETNGNGVHAAGQQAVEALLVQQVAIGDHAPGVFAAVEFEAHLLKVGTQQSLATGKDNEDFVRVNVRSDGVYHLKEVLGRHVGDRGLHLAVGAAMAATHIAAQRALPEEGAKGMQLFVGLA